ncbi:MAG: trypsin-like peptidase domain-containing protein [Candidatus Yanofskybacteria bacterium]|nr:trypsin-like peptidase domain-containing protein [Candidatus Yanofskybacteria bacterium]
MSYTKTILAGFLGGAAAWFLLFSFPGSNSLLFSLIKADLTEFLGTAPTPTPTPVIAFSDFWQKIVSDHVLSTVVVQSFKGGKVTREGNGIIISSDGIIITTFDVVAGADVYQVLHGDKILRAQLVRYDGFKNLALLKVAATDMNVTRLERDYQFQPGQDVVVSGKMVELSNSVVFAQRGMISYILSKDIVIDTEPTYFLSGSKVINNSGIVVGMAYLKSGAVRLVKSEAIDDFVKNYFETL